MSNKSPKFSATYLRDLLVGLQRLDVLLEVLGQLGLAHVPHQVLHLQVEEAAMARPRRPALPKHRPGHRLDVPIGGKKLLLSLVPLRQAQLNKLRDNSTSKVCKNLSY